MKLTDKAIEGIKTRDAQLRLALALGYTAYWVSKLVASNKENGSLTTALALKAISEETGLSQSEILAEEPVEVTK